MRASGRRLSGSGHVHALFLALNGQIRAIFHPADEAKLRAAAPRQSLAPSSPTAATAGCGPTVLHFHRNGLKDTGIQCHARNGKETLFFVAYVRLIGRDQTLGHFSELVHRGHLVRLGVQSLDDVVESLVEHEVVLVFRCKPSDERSKLSPMLEAREERDLFVLFMALHGAFEECGDVTEGLDIGSGVTSLVSRPPQIVEALFQAAMGAFELDEWVMVHEENEMSDRARRQSVNGGLLDIVRENTPQYAPSAQKGWGRGSAYEQDFDAR
jgi:hypothetical protein